MRLRILCTAAALVAFAAPPALASGASYTGGCNFDSVKLLPVSRGQGGRYTGVLTLSIAVVPGSDLGVEADVTCELMVDGVAHTTIGPVRAHPAAVGTAPFSVGVDYPWSITTCETVVYTDGTPTDHVCGDWVAICDPMCRVREETDPYVDPIEAGLCDRIGGDVYAGGQWLVDCPPYGPY